MYFHCIIRGFLTLFCEYSSCKKVCSYSVNIPALISSIKVGSYSVNIPALISSIKVGSYSVNIPALIRQHKGWLLFCEYSSSN